MEVRERKRFHVGNVIIREEWEGAMVLLNAVSKSIHRKTDEILSVGSAALRTAAVDGMPGTRRHAPPWRFFVVTRSVLLLVFVTTLLVTGCKADSVSDERLEGRLVITDEEILLTLPKDSPEEPYTAVSSVPLDTNTIDDSFFEIENEIDPVGEEVPSPHDGDGDDISTREFLDNHALFSLQVGAFIFDRNLETQAEELEEHGFTHYVDETERVVLMFCPIVREGLTRNDAEAFMERFPTNVVEPVMIPTDEERFDVTAGLFYYREDAKMVTERLEDMGYNTTIEERTVEVVIKRLRVGYYEEIELAKKDSRLLENLGYDPIIVKVQK